MKRISDRATFLIEYLDLADAVGDPDASWEVFQLRHLNNDAQFAIDRKSRQVGWSWTAAAESVANCCLIPRHTALFVSINQDEAAEKIRYAKQIIAALDREVRPRLSVDNRLELELANGSRMVSHPCRPVRGKARADVYLDEFAHYPKDREIYVSALPVTTRGGRIRIGSSPLGAGGLFWEIASQTMRPWPGFRRGMIPWWEVRALSHDTIMAGRAAPSMQTDERVQRFGTTRLRDLFENMLLEDFAQEYECAWMDEQEAWIPWDDIKRNQALAQEGKLQYWQARDVQSAFDAIEKLAEASRKDEIETSFFAGVDIGRKHDLTELILVGKTSAEQYPYRLGISLSNMAFDDQFAVLVRVWERIRVVGGLIDQNGLGMQMAEQLHKRFGDRAQGANFTNETKEQWAVELKIGMQRGQVPIPLDRELSYQIHSIKKTVTASKNNVFDTVRNEKHHADKFWALALAKWAATIRKSKASINTRANIGNYRG